MHFQWILWHKKNWESESSEYPFKVFHVPWKLNTPLKCSMFPILTLWKTLFSAPQSSIVTTWVKLSQSLQDHISTGWDTRCFRTCSIRGSFKKQADMWTGWWQRTLACAQSNSTMISSATIRSGSDLFLTSGCWISRSSSLGRTLRCSPRTIFVRCLFLASPSCGTKTERTGR